MEEQSITDGEKDYVNQTLRAKGDTFTMMEWVTKTRRNKVQKRLLVVGKYRIYSIKRKFDGKKSVQRDGHFLELLSLQFTDNADELSMNWKDFNIEIVTPKALEIANIVLQNFNSFAADFPEKKRNKWMTNQYGLLHNDAFQVALPNEKGLTPSQCACDAIQSHWLGSDPFRWAKPIQIDCFCGTARKNLLDAKPSNNGTRISRCDIVLACLLTLCLISAVSADGPADNVPVYLSPVMKAVAFRPGFGGKPTGRGA